MSHETEFDDMTDTMVDIARLKSFVALGFDLVFLFMAAVIVGIGYPLIGAVVAVLAVFGSIVSIGRNERWVRRYVEWIPSFEYEFPPLDEYESERDG